MGKLGDLVKKERLDIIGLIPLVWTGMTAIIAFLKQPVVHIFDIWFTTEEARLLADGVFNTVAISTISIVCGTILGAALAYLARPAFDNRSGRRRSRVPPALKLISLLARGLLYIMLAVPVYVLLIFGMGLFTSPYVTAIVFLSLNLAVFVCRLVVRAFETLPTAQIEAALAAGARGWSLLWKFEFPALWRSCGAGITNEWATTLKLSSLVGVVSAYDIMMNARIVLDNTFDTRVFLVVVAVYVVLTVPIFVLSDRYTRQHG